LYEKRESILKNKKLINFINNELTNINYDNNKIATLNNLLNKIPTKQQCRGNKRFVVPWIMYLLYNNKNSNICLPEDNTYNIRATIYIDLSNLNKSKYPINMKDIVMLCKKRYIVFNLFLSIDKATSNHANLLIIDKYLKTVERFEPHGESNYDIENILDSFLYNNIISQIKEYTYIKPLDFCPSIGPQAKQLYNRRCEEESGFCLTWSIYYFHMRLINPNIDSNIIINNILKDDDWQLLIKMVRYQTLIELVVLDLFKRDKFFQDMLSHIYHI